MPLWKKEEIIIIHKQCDSHFYLSVSPIFTVRLVCKVTINAASVTHCPSTLFARLARWRSMGLAMALTIREPTGPRQRPNTHSGCTTILKMKQGTFFCNFTHYFIVQPVFWPVIVFKFRNAFSDVTVTQKKDFFFLIFIIYIVYSITEEKKLTFLSRVILVQLCFTYTQ